jgi:hypothetical protein
MKRLIIAAMMISSFPVSAYSQKNKGPATTRTENEMKEDGEVDKSVSRNDEEIREQRTSCQERSLANHKARRYRRYEALKQYRVSECSNSAATGRWRHLMPRRDLLALKGNADLARPSPFDRQWTHSSDTVEKGLVIFGEQ